MAGEISEVISVDAGPGLAGLKEFTSALEDAADKWAAFQDKLSSGLGGGGADKLAASMDEAAAQISAAADKAASSLERIGEASDSAAGGVERLDEAAATAGGSLDEAAAGADAAAAASDRLAESADDASASLDVMAVSAGRARDTGDEAAASSEGFGKTAKLALLGVGVAAAYGIDKAMKFQSQMLLLNTQAGVSMPNVKKMSQGVLEISTQTGQSLTSVAESAYHVASNMESLGGTPVQMLNAVKIAAEGASVGHSNLVDTTNALTSVIASGIPGAKNYSQAMGAINSTVGAGDMTMQDLSEAMATGVVPVVKGYGLTLKDVGAALATYGDLNIRGAKAGTELRMAVQALAVPAAAGTAELNKLGLSTTSLSKDMESGGLSKALDDLNARFEKNGITAKNMGGVITDIFGKKAGAGLSLLMENLDRFQSKYPALTKGANDFNAAWERTNATPAQKWKELTAGLQASAVNFGTALLPAFSAAAGFADRILADINNTKGAADALGIGFGALAALFTGKKLVSGVESAFQTGESVLRGIGKIGSVLNIPGMDKLATLGQGQATGAAALDTSAANLDGAAEALTGAAEKLGGSGELGGAAKAEGAAGAEAEGGGMAGAVSAARAALGPVSLGVIVGTIIKGLGDQIAPAGSTAGKYNAMLQKTPATNDSSLMPYIFGGFEGKLMGSIGESIGGAINKAVNFTAGSFDTTRHQVASAGNYIGSSFAGVGSGTAKDFDTVKSAAQTAMSAVGAAVSTGMSRAVAAIASGAARAGSVAASGFHTVVSAASSAMSAAASAVSSGAGKVVSGFESIASGAESALASLPGKLASIGTAAVDGLASGIEAGIGAVVGAAERVAGAVEGAMKDVLKIFSPSKVTQTIGASAAEGLVVGLQGGTSAVNAAATALGKNVAKATDITSIDQNVTKLLGYVPAGDSGLTKMLKADQGKLTSLANQRAALETQITDSQQIAQQALSNANIMNAGTYTPALAASSGPLASSATISGMQSMLADQQAFASQVGQLKSGGLNATSLNQIIQSGASSGLPVAEGLTSGGKSAIQQVNKLEAQLQASAAKLGDEGAGPMYQAGIQAGQGLALGIKAEMGAVDNAIKALAQSMVAAAKTALKSHSPSLVFADIGYGIPQGVALGVDAGTPVAQAAVGRMGSRLGGGHPGIDYGHAGGGGGGHGGGSVTIINHYSTTVQGSVMSENDLATTVQRVFNKRGSNNWQTGLVLPGRKG